MLSQEEIKKIKKAIKLLKSLLPTEELQTLDDEDPPPPPPDDDDSGSNPPGGHPPGHP